MLVCYRDQADVTLRCLHSLARQHVTGELELVLVDNQSRPDQAQKVTDAARAMFGDERVIALRYDAPFNHSAQNNLAAEAATGEVLVICNNDVVLEEPTALEQLAAWALQEGVATVGCRLENDLRGAGSYGHVLRRLDDDPFRACLGENPDAAFSRFVHAAPGNTLALAAIRRDRFFAIGGLDARRFPVGYNDAEFMLRAAREGYRHLYLGHVAARHMRGHSRTGDNEDAQAFLINRLYPEATAARFAQLVQERVEPPPETAKAKAAAPNPPPAEAAPEPEADASAPSEDARREAEAQRARLAAVLASASDLSRQLAAELTAAQTAALGD
ncbi:MAG: glycosyltransferase [Caulobacteraceae bacterium]